MACEISSDICSKIVIAINFIKKCSKQRSDIEKIATILNSAYGLAIISLKHYESGPPSYVIVDQASMLSLIKASFMAQFSYCSLILMFHNINLNNKINTIHEQALRIV